MPVTFYHFPISGPSRGSLLSARAVGAPLEVEIVDVMKKEQLKESFVRINPQHCLPTLDDDGFVLWESHAISCYLADKYAKNDDWYPKDLQHRAVVHQRLSFENTTLYVKQKAVTVPILFQGKKEIGKAEKDDLNSALGVLNMFLSKSKWVAGEKPTIADTTLYATVSTILKIDWDISAFPELERWVKQCQSLPGHEENEAGAKAYGDLFLSCFKS